jgi:hypothetical protein
MYLGFNDPFPRDSLIPLELIPKAAEPASDDGAEAGAKRCMEQF